MSAVSIGEYHGLRVGSALLSIVSGCIIIGVSKDCGADAVGGIFLGAGGLGLLISVYPFIKTWLSVHHILPNIGNFRIHPTAPVPTPTPTPAPAPAPERPSDVLIREGTQVQVERAKSRMGTSVDAGAAAPESSQGDGTSADVPDILGRS